MVPGALSIFLSSRGLSFAKDCLGNSSSVAKCSSDHATLTSSKTRLASLVPSCKERFLKLGALFSKNKDSKSCYQSTYTPYSTCKKTFEDKIKNMYNGTVIFKSLENKTKSSYFCPYAARTICW